MKYSFFFILIEFGDFFAAIYSFHSVKKQEIIYQDISIKILTFY